MHDVEVAHHTARADAERRVSFIATILVQVMRAQIKIY